MSLFDLDREKKILKSQVREIFTPHRPINSIDLFFGRSDEVKQLISYLNTPGQHALLYGDRGVGKSSLANVAVLYLDTLIDGETYIKRCDDSDTFLNIMRKPLEALQYNLELESWEEGTDQGGSAGLTTPVAKADISSKRAKNRKFNTNRKALNPSFVAEVLQSTPGLLLIDEADAIADRERKKLAQLVKLLGDNGSPFKILLVGVAETGQALIDSHPSVQRNLKETKLGRMSEQELRDIVEGGARKAKLKFTKPVTQKIISVSAGYPHFTQLICLKCAEEAVANSIRDIRVEILDTAMKLAVKEAEGSLKRSYDDAVRSHQTDGYEVVLLASAMCDKPEFRAAEVINNVEKILGKTITSQGLNNYWNRLVSDGETTVLKRLAKGVYRFNDPRMPSYVRIANSKRLAKIGIE